MMADRMPDHTITIQTRMNCAPMAVPPIPVLQVASVVETGMHPKPLQPW